jgi:hypothetical protein
MGEAQQEEAHDCNFIYSPTHEIFSGKPCPVLTKNAEWKPEMADRATVGDAIQSRQFAPTIYGG